MTGLSATATAVCSPIPALLAGRARAALSTSLYSSAVQCRDPVLDLLAVPGTARDPGRPDPSLVSGRLVCSILYRDCSVDSTRHLGPGGGSPGSSLGSGGSPLAL